MSTATSPKKERINIRLKSGAKKIIERAAGFEGKTVSHFILESALERAEKTVKEHETISLNMENSRAFFNALEAPVRFNSALLSALEEHDRRVDVK